MKAKRKLPPNAERMYAVIPAGAGTVAGGGAGLYGTSRAARRAVEHLADRGRAAIVLPVIVTPDPDHTPEVTA